MKFMVTQENTLFTSQELDMALWTSGVRERLIPHEELFGSYTQIKDHLGDDSFGFQS